MQDLIPEGRLYYREIVLPESQKMILGRHGDTEYTHCQIVLDRKKPQEIGSPLDGQAQSYTETHWQSVQVRKRVQYGQAEANPSLFANAENEW